MFPGRTFAIQTLPELPFKGAYLLLARFERVDLSTTKGLSADLLATACGDAKTKLPAGQSAPASWPCDRNSQPARMSLQAPITFCVAAAIVAVVPGPSITVIVANSLHYDIRAGLLNIAGMQAGLVAMLAIPVAGLATIVETMGLRFDRLRFIGAAYLICLGYRMFTSRADFELAEANGGNRPNFFVQGLFVVLSNPKALLSCGAFIPQFVDAHGSYVLQTIALGSVCMVITTIIDSAYALPVENAGSRLSRSRIRLTQRISGALLVGGGVRLAFARRWFNA